MGALASTASTIRTPRVRIMQGDDVVATSQSADGEATGPASEAAEDADSATGRPTVAIDLVTEGRATATLTAILAGRPLFLEDDVELLELLGSLTARAVEREEAVARLTDATRALDEAGAVRASEARFRALLDAEPNAMLSVDASGTIRWCTQSAAAMFRATESSLVGRRLDEVVAPGNEARGAASSQAGIDRYETIGTRAGGDTFPAEVALSHLELDGEPAQLAVIADVTWRHDADENRATGSSASCHTSCGPRSPRSSAATQVLLHRGAQLEPGTRDALLEDVAAESERLQRMIENLLILARVERGAEVVDVVPVLMHRVLPDVVAREGANWPAMTITSDIEPGLPLVAGDDASLALVLRNLISNAGKYAGGAASVQVTATRDAAGGVAVRVEDDGPGIDPAEAEALFGLYFRSRAERDGAGIGHRPVRVPAAHRGDGWPDLGAFAAGGWRRVRISACPPGRRRPWRPTSPDGTRPRRRPRSWHRARSGWSLAALDLAITGSAPGPVAPGLVAPDVDQVAAAFDLGRPIGRPVVGARGELGRIWAVTTDRGRWAVKELLEPMSPRRAATDVAFQEAALAAGIPMPSPRRRPDGRVLARVRQGDATCIVRAYGWVDLQPGTVAPGDAGALLARIHAVLIPTARPAHPWFRQAMAETRWHALEARVTDAAPTWSPAFYERFADIVASQRALRSMRWVPDRICHLDVNPQNVLLGADGGLVVVDWENANPGEPSQELGMAALDFGLEDDAATARFIDGYRAAGGPGRMMDRGSFAMALAVYGHLIDRYARGALDPAGSDEDRARSAFWIADMLASPVTLPRIDRVLAGT